VLFYGPNAAAIELPRRGLFSPEPRALRNNAVGLVEITGRNAPGTHQTLANRVDTNVILRREVVPLQRLHDPERRRVITGNRWGESTVETD
jgi:hypothetical protein